MADTNAEISVEAIRKAAEMLDSAAVPSDRSRSVIMSMGEMKRCGMTDEQIALAMREKGYETERGTIYGYDKVSG